MRERVTPAMIGDGGTTRGLRRPGPRPWTRLVGWANQWGLGPWPQPPEASGRSPTAHVANHAACDIFVGVSRRRMVDYARMRFRLALVLLIAVSAIAGPVEEVRD